jgi:hypothetical protein
MGDFEKYYRLKRFFNAKEKTLTGKMAEAWLKASSFKRRIPSYSGLSQYRVPDILTDKELIEIKNVKYLPLTIQLKDFLQYCEKENLKFIIYIRRETIVSNRVKKLEMEGRILIKDLGPVFTKKGQETLKKALMPIIMKALGKIQ